MADQVPIYLFLGFLEAGKTKFIQETFEDERFDSGENTLLLVCEEGENEYDPARFKVKKFAIENIDESELELGHFLSLEKKYRPERVVIEFNGMRTLDALFDALPDRWVIAQVMTFFDSSTFLTYNKNMRQLVFDKIQVSDMVVFNRYVPSMSKEELHKIVRGISRRPGIVYEQADGTAEYDEIEDPLPFDIEAPVIKIEDRDYAFFYRDLVEDPKKYAGKTVHFKGLVAVDRKMKQGTIVVGRHIMTCCEADITYSGLVCLHTADLPLQTRDWVEVTARIDLEYHKIYGQKGPVLKASEVKRAFPPEQELATFY